MNNLEENKNLVLGATNTRLSDEDIEVSSTNSIAQEGGFENGGCCFHDPQVHEEKKLTHIQEIYAKLKNLPKEVEYDKPHVGNLKEIKLGYTYTSRIPTIDFVYEISGYKPIIDTYVFYDNNDDYLLHTLGKLDELLALYDFVLAEDDTNDLNSIIRACNSLIGTKVQVMRYQNDRGYDKCKVIYTEKLQPVIDDFNI